MSDPPAPVRTRREPPAFRHMTAQRVEQLSPRLVRVTFSGPGLSGLIVDQPAASVRLLLRSAGTPELVLPAWNGNEFLLPDGQRPVIRTFTPRRSGPDWLEVEMVVHGSGAASEWAAAARPGEHAAVSGPGRGYTVDPDAPAFLLAGDETAIPAVGQLLELLPPGTPVEVHLEVAHPDGRVELPPHPRANVEWHDLPPGTPAGDTLIAAVRAADVTAQTRVWVAGEAAGVQRIRRYLFEELELARAMAWVRGYWKHGRSGDGDAD